jgi:hypothetical protein
MRKRIVFLFLLIFISLISFLVVEYFRIGSVGPVSVYSAGATFLSGLELDKNKTPPKPILVQEKLGTEPILTMDDMVYYSLFKHELKLTSEAQRKFMGCDPPYRRCFRFVVCIGQERIFDGATGSVYDSMVPVPADLYVTRICPGDPLEKGLDPEVKRREEQNINWIGFDKSSAPDRGSGLRILKSFFLAGKLRFL